MSPKCRRILKCPRISIKWWADFYIFINSEAKMYGYTQLSNSYPLNFSFYSFFFSSHLCLINLLFRILNFCINARLCFVNPEVKMWGWVYFYQLIFYWFRYWWCACHFKALLSPVSNLLNACVQEGSKILQKNSHWKGIYISLMALVSFLTNQ